MKTTRTPLSVLLCALLMQAAAQAGTPSAPDKRLVERGRYLVQVAGCNACHTQGYTAAAGKVDEKLWLTGDGFGWSGPWGTSYATNLRLFVANLSEAQWLKHVDTMRPRPPMPWFNLQAMTVNDRKALYAYLKTLGPAGQPAAAALPPGKPAPQPYALFPG